MKRTNFKVLQIEDNPGDARLVAELLSEVGAASFELVWKSRLEEGLESLAAGSFDVVLLDLELPDSFGLETVTRTLKAAPRIPIIVMSSLKDEDVAATAVQKGAQDYLFKGIAEPSLLYSSIRYAVERKKAAVQLAESEARLLRAQKIAHLGSWELDRLDNRLVWSDEVYRIFGLKPREFAATYEAFLHAVHPDDRAAVDEAYSSSIREDRDGYEIEHRVLRPSGEVRYVHERSQHFRDESGRIVRSTGMVHDITRRKQSEAALGNAVNESRRRWEETDALLTATRSVLLNRDFEDAARPIFEACKQVTGATSGYVALLGHDRRQHQILFLDPGIAPCCDLDDPGLPLPVRTLRDTAYDTRKAVYRNNIGGDGDAEPEMMGHEPLESVMLAPLVAGEQAVGLIGLANKPPGFSENDIRLVSAFAELMSVALANSQALKSLEKSEERFRSITASASDAVLSADYQGNIVTWNQAAAAMFGYNEEEAIGLPVSMLMPESFRELHRQGVESYLATGEPKIMGRAVELAALRKDGAEFPIELSLSSWTTSEGTFFGSVIRDVTERRQMFEEIDSSRQFSEALNNISLILNSTLDFDEIMKDTIGSAADALAADSAFLASGPEGKPVFRYAQGLSRDTPVGGMLTPDNAPVAAKVLKSGKTAAVSEMFGDERFAEVAQKNSIRATIVAPIIIRSEVAGVIAFRYHAQSREFSQAQMDFVEKLSILVSLAMENAGLYRSEKETRATVQGYAVQLSILHEIGISLNRESNREHLQQIILSSAAELTAAGICMMTQTVDGKYSLTAAYQAPWYHSQLFSLQEQAPLLHRHLLDMVGDSDVYALRLEDLQSLPWFPDVHTDLRQLLVGILRDTRGRARSLFLLGDKADGAGFTRTDEEIVSLLAAQSSVALTSAENFEKEHYVAETLQSCLLPEVPVRDDFEIGLRYRSASEVGRIGGDFYDIVELSDGKVALAIGDVCGKGLSAASHTAMVKFMLRAYLEEGREPGECLALLNNALCRNLSIEKFITLGLAVLDPATNAIRYSLAGHPLPFIYAENHGIELDVPNTVPLGVVPGYAFPSRDAIFPPGASIMMYTDGVLEAKSPEGEMFGRRRLVTAFTSRGCLPAQKIAESIVNRVMEFSGDRLADDVALLVMRSLKMPAGQTPGSDIVSSHPGCP